VILRNTEVEKQSVLWRLTKMNFTSAGKKYWLFPCSYLNNT